MSGRLVYLTDDVGSNRVEVDSFFVRAGGKEYVGGRVQSNFLSTWGGYSEAWILDVAGPAVDKFGPPISFDMHFPIPIGGYSAPEKFVGSEGLGYLMFGDRNTNFGRAFINFDVTKLSIARATAVPEPDTLSMILLGLVLVINRKSFGLFRRAD